jgi:hypothetical protein
LIAQQLLFQLNYNFIEYLAFEAAFEARKEQYLVSLTKALNSRNQVKEDISEWILFFLDCIELSINHLEHRLKPLQAVLKTLDPEKVVLNEVHSEKPIQKQVIVVEAETPISKKVNNKKEKTIETPISKKVNNKKGKTIETPISNQINNKKEEQIEIPITKVADDKPEKKIEIPIIKEKIENIVELPLSKLLEDNNIKIIDNQSIKPENVDTTTYNNHDSNPIDLNEMVDNPIEIENNLSKSEVYLSPRQKKLKKFIVERQPTRLGDLKMAFPEINQHIIKKDLQYMHRLNEIQKNGDFKTTVYTVANT